MKHFVLIFYINLVILDYYLYKIVFIYAIIFYFIEVKHASPIVPFQIVYIFK